MPGQRLKGLPPLPKLTKEPRPLKVEKRPTRPKGPRRFRLEMQPRNVGQGPGEPPPGFLNQWNSKSEWRYYWALCRHLRSPRNCRQGPFVGGNDWTYQTQDPVFGGRIPGGNVMDFVVKQGKQVIGLRIQTERYHVMASSAQQVKDTLIKENLTAYDRVMDLFDQYSVGDASGKATIEQVARALKGIADPDPLRLGTAQRVRPGR